MALLTAVPSNDVKVCAGESALASHSFPPAGPHKSKTRDVPGAAWHAWHGCGAVTCNFWQASPLQLAQHRQLGLTSTCRQAHFPSQHNIVLMHSSTPKQACPLATLTMARLDVQAVYTPHPHLFSWIAAMPTAEQVARFRHQVGSSRAKDVSLSALSF